MNRRSIFSLAAALILGVALTACSAKSSVSHTELTTGAEPSVSFTSTEGPVETSAPKIETAAAEPDIAESTSTADAATGSYIPDHGSQRPEEPAPVYAPPPPADPLDVIWPLIATLPPMFQTAASQVNWSVGCDPTGSCKAGWWNPDTNTIWLQERSLRHPLLRDLLIHEIAHAIDARMLPVEQRQMIYAVMGKTGIRPMEAFADCAVKVISGGWTSYWQCDFEEAYRVTAEALGR